MKHAIFLSLIWALFPTIHVIWEGGVLGSSFTDLYPSIWSLWAYSNVQWTHWTHTFLFNYPNGMGWYPPSIIHNLIAYPLQLFLHQATIYNFLLILFRFLCPFLSYLAARSWKISEEGSLMVAVLFGCSPFFHGFAVEGIIEGLNGWTIALWLYFCGRENRLGMIFAFALCCISNWYFAACVCVMAVVMAFHKKSVLWSFLGLIPVIPFVYLFIEAWPNISPIEIDVRQSMGASWEGFFPTTQTSLFAKNNYISWIALFILCRYPKKNSYLICVPLLLSFNIFGALPIFEHIRFPYRFHAVTLLVIAYLIHPNIKMKWYAYAILLECSLLGGLPLQIPTSPIHTKASYKMVDAPILHVPGTFSMPPGKANPSRIRYGEILLAQIQHGQPLANMGNFNSLEGTWERDVWLQQDPLYIGERPSIIPKDILQLTGSGIVYIAVHPNWLSNETTTAIRSNQTLQLISDQSHQNLLLYKIR